MPTPAEAIAEVNRVYREFNRYTGDGKPGEPVNAPLPVGDPQSGVANPKKAELRAMLITVLLAAGLAVGEAEAAVDRAEAEADRAAEAAEAAEAALSSVSVTSFATRASAIAYNPVAGPLYMQLQGYAAAGDGGAALYKRVASEPAHAGKFQIAQGSWYEIAELVHRPAMFGAAVNAGSNQRTAIQAMLDGGSAVVEFPNGIWRADSDLTVTRDITIRGPGIVDFSNGNGQLVVSGALSALSKMSIDRGRGSRVLPFSTNQGLAARDIVMLYNPTNFSFGSRRPEYRDGGMFEIHSISGNNANIYGQCEDAYVATAMDVYKLVPCRVVIDGLGLYEGTGNKAALKLYRCARNVIRNVHGKSETYALLELDQCFSTDIEAGNVANNSPVVGDEYGIEVANSQYTTIRGGTLMATRHAVALGGYDKAGAVPTRYTKVIGCNLLNQSADAGAADAHGNADFTTYENCLIANGSSVAGRNPRLVNCIVYEGTSAGTGLVSYSAEYAGGDIIFDGCAFYSNGSGSSYGFIYIGLLGPNTGTPTPDYPAATNLRDDVRIALTNCKLITPNSAANADAVQVRCSNANKKVSVKIENLEWIAPLGRSFLFIDDSVLGTRSGDFLIVDDAFGPAGSYLIYPTTMALARATREMQQSGRANVTTPATNLIAAAAQSFRYVYSRMPDISTSVTSTDGSTQNVVGGRPSSAKAQALNGSGVTMLLITNDGNSFSAGAQAALHWSVGLRGT